MMMGCANAKVAVEIDRDQIRAQWCGARSLALRLRRKEVRLSGI